MILTDDLLRAAYLDRQTLQALNPDVPYQFFVMLPYVLAVVFLIVFAGRVAMPSALGVPFLGERRGRKRRGA